jgi:hypothetical protein
MDAQGVGARGGDDRRMGGDIVFVETATALKILFL